MIMIAEVDDLIDDDGDVEAAPAPEDADLKNVATLAYRAIDIEREIAQLQEQLRQKQDAHKTIVENDLPLALTSLGMTEFKLIGGASISIKDIVAASITEVNRKAAHEWLEKHGHGSLIKRTITITFGKGEEKWAAKFMRDMAQRKKPLRAQIKEAVNYQTLGAFVREQVQGARNRKVDPQKVIPYPLFGVYEIKVAEIDLPPQIPG